MSLGETYTPGFRQAHAAKAAILAGGDKAATLAGADKVPTYNEETHLYTVHRRLSIHTERLANLTSRLSLTNDRITGPTPVEASPKPDGYTPSALIDMLHERLSEGERLLHWLESEVERTERL